MNEYIDKNDLLKRLSISEKINADVPTWVITVIKNMPICPKVTYICDRQRCEDGKCFPDCKRTTDVRHAVNFRKVFEDDEYYEEKGEEL